MASGTIKSVVPRSDIVNNLTTNDSTKVLSAAQGYALNSNIANRPIGEVVGVSGTTTSAGQIDVSVTNSYSYAYILSNVSEGLSNPYSVTVSQINNTTHKITLRIRNMSDNSAVANTQVGFNAMIIGK